MSPPRAEDVLAAWVAGRAAPGLAAARFGPDRIHVACAGHASPGRPLTPEHSFAWFSVTKLVTTLAVLRRVERRELGLDDPLSQYLPGVAVGRTPTIEDLLRHRAGLPDPIPWGWLQLPEAPRSHATELAERWLLRHAPRWWRRGEAPGQGTPRYSNLSFMALGAVLGDLDGREPHEILQDELRLLGLERSCLELAPRDAAGHTAFGSPFDLAMWLAGARRASRGVSGRWRVLHPVRMEVAAAGGAVGPIGELAAFGRAWLFGQGLGVSEGLRSSALEGPGPFGLGFWRAGNVAYHEGSGLGFVSSLRLDLLRSRGLAILANRSGRLRPEWPDLSRLAAELDGAAWDP